MQRLNHWIVSTSRRWWLVGLILLLNYLSFRILFGLEDAFEVITGLPVFDTQNNLTAAALLQQLPLYNGAALTAYLCFAAFDWVFPFVAALFQAVLWALLLRTNRSSIAQRLLQLNLPMWAFVTTIFDYLENISLLAILAVGSTAGGWLADVAIVCKRLKLTGLGLSTAITTGLLAFSVGHWLYRIWRGRQHTDAASASGSKIS
jgi:hypothetical protein